MALFVGCDLGTMGTKSAVVEENGTIVSLAYEQVALHSPTPGSVTQDLLEIEASAHRTINRAVRCSGRGDEIAAVAFSSQMSGIGAIDRRFRPALAFDSWLDGRSLAQVKQLRPHAERITQLSGCPPTASHAPKLKRWLEDPHLDTDAVHRVLVPGAFVAGRLAGLDAGRAYIDHTSIHFSNLADTARGCWSDELIALVGVQASWLPEIVSPLALIGEVSADGAARTGLPPGTPIAAGAGDQATAQLGAGAITPGSAFESAGTASVLGVSVPDFRPDPRRQRFLAARAVLPGTFLILSFINGGGLALRWFRDEIASGLRDDPDAYARLDALAEAIAPGADGLLWFPHLQGRVLPAGPSDRGAWIGLNAGHTLAHLYRAILEGIALEYASWLDADGAGAPGRPTEVRAFGGGARSTLWNQIKADVLGATWVPAPHAECGVIGAALIAAAASGHVSDLAATARQWQAPGEPVMPDPVNHAVYRQLAAAYAQLDRRLAPIFAALTPS